MIKCFLGAVKDLWKVGGLWPEHLLHLPVKYLVGASKIIPIGARLESEAKTAHKSLNAAQVSLADFSSLFIVQIQHMYHTPSIIVFNLAHHKALTEKMCLL
jgi:hypothetical protein